MEFQTTVHLQILKMQHLFHWERSKLVKPFLIFSTITPFQYQPDL